MKMMFHLWVHFCAAHGNLGHGVFVPARVVVSQGEGLWGCCDPRLDTGMSGGHPFVSNNSNQFFDVLLCFPYVFLKKSQISQLIRSANLQTNYKIGSNTRSQFAIAHAANDQVSAPAELSEVEP